MNKFMYEGREMFVNDSELEKVDILFKLLDKGVKLNLKIRNGNIEKSTYSNFTNAVLMLNENCIENDIFLKLVELNYEVLPINTELKKEIKNGYLLYSIEKGTFNFNIIKKGCIVDNVYGSYCEAEHYCSSNKSDYVLKDNCLIKSKEFKYEKEILPTERPWNATVEHDFGVQDWKDE